jgi:hypothetical protein
VFDDFVDVYQTWALFLISISVVILTSGVVLLTLKKPENRGGAPATPGVPKSARSIRPGRRRSDDKRDLERRGGRRVELEGRELDDDQALWELGEMSDDEDGNDGRSTGGRSEWQSTSRRQLSPDISRKPEPPKSWGGGTRSDGW